ncbi:MAG: uncharacterized membrane protein YbaN (DUF454 family) [Cognaticolwellia sp.]|jgi:uncharacterized membrane protein YbaN (DUF454 family)
MFLKIVGILFVALAFMGVFLPLLPTTPFLLVAAACFAKSSPRLHSMLLSNKIFGPMIYHWQKTRSIPQRAKVLALLSMVLAVLWSVYILPSIWLKALVVALVAWPFVFICRLPNAEKQKTALLLSEAPDNSASKITVKNRKNL